MKSTGILIAADLYDCDKAPVSDCQTLKQDVITIAEKFNLEPNTAHLEPETDGEFTIIMTCKRGHVALHVYPSRCFTAVDVFSCNTNADPDKFLKNLSDILNPDKVKITYITRVDNSAPDMKPRKRTKTKTVNRMKKMSKKFGKIMMKPRSL